MTALALLTASDLCYVLAMGESSLMGNLLEAVHEAYEREREPASGSGTNVWLRAAARATDDKRTYQEKLESASTDEVFRYVFLINNASVEQYVGQSRSQAEVSFALSRKAAIAGFALLLIAVVVGVVAELTDHSLSIAYLTGIGGIVTQFISGVFFWIYNRTLQQINLFYQGIMSQQTDALAALGRSSEALREAEKGRQLAEIIRSPVTDPEPR